MNELRDRRSPQEQHDYEVSALRIGFFLGFICGICLGLSL